MLGLVWVGSIRNETGRRIAALIKPQLPTGPITLGVKAKRNLGHPVRISCTKSANGVHPGDRGTFKPLVERYFDAVLFFSMGGDFVRRCLPPEADYFMALCSAPKN
jgi:hypothetical protein